MGQGNPGSRSRPHRGFRFPTRPTKRKGLAVFTPEQMREFVGKVREMRKAQKEYFRKGIFLSRSFAALKAAKQLETYVDEMIEQFDLLEQQAQKLQQRQFL